jgi:hypothetical protein
MVDKEALCKKIESIYPDIGECGIDVNVDYNDELKSWAVYLKKGNQEVKHYLDENDAALCMDGKQCVSLGIEISQLKDMSERYGKEK